MMLARESIDLLTKRINNLSKASKDVLEQMLSQIQYASIADLRNQTIELMNMVCGGAADYAAAYTAEMYDDIRAEAIGSDYKAVAVSGIDLEATEGAIRAFVGEVDEEDGTGFANFANKLFDRADYEIKRASGECVMRNTVRDPARPRFARVPTGFETCGFCLMLASRGAVYFSAQTAGGHYHAHCDCRVVPVFDGMEIEGYDPDALYQEWKDSDHANYMKRRGSNPNRKRKSNYAFEGKDGLPSFKNFNDVKAYLYGAKTQEELSYRFSMLGNIFGFKSPQMQSQSLKNVAKTAGKRISGLDGKTKQVIRAAAGKSKYPLDNLTKVEAIKTAINSSNKTFCSRGDYLIEDAKNIKLDETSYHIVMHGDPDGCYVYGHKLSAKEFAKIVRERGDYKNEEISLISCSLGDERNGECFAQQLANELGTNVIAATRKLWPDGTAGYIIADKYFGEINKGSFKKFEPKNEHE